MTSSLFCKGAVTFARSRCGYNIGKVLCFALLYSGVSFGRWSRG